MTRMFYAILMVGTLLLAGCGDSSTAEKEAVTSAQTPTEITPVEVAPVAVEAATETVAEVTGGELADYARVTGISGNLSSIGSDTLANLMTLWTESFKRNYPSVNIQVLMVQSTKH